MIALSLALRIVCAREIALGNLRHLNHELLFRLRQVLEPRMKDHRVRLHLADWVVADMKGLCCRDEHGAGGSIGIFSPMGGDRLTV